MATMEEYLRMAEDAQPENAHVAVLMYYRSAIEEIGYNTNVVPILLAAVKYAQRLKKERDRQTVADWSSKVLGIINSTSLEDIIAPEIAKLQAGGNKNATTS